ncbi:MAG: beta-ACP synthase [Prevotellaceae bacterium]|jgi:3-oxoacyl-(acyl-carrier-protein) synthase|nr:beta-ACP synthase [Prevotellaceae bacterium]
MGIPAPALTGHKVFVAADNIISALGFSTEETMNAVWRGETGIKRMYDAAVYPAPFHAGYIDRQRFRELCGQYGLLPYAPFEALVILSIREALRGTALNPADEKMLFILSSTKGNIGYLHTCSPAELARKRPESLQEAMLWRSAQRVAGYFGMKNTPLVVSSACVSGVAAVELGARLLREGLYETAIITGADEITAFTVSGFQAFKSVSPEPCRPYDRRRDGLSTGEGAGTLALTRREDYAPAGRKIYILGGATANDANHISAPSRTGDGLHYAIENALARANVPKSALDFINLHGTATIFNDEMESKALALSALSDVPANSLKGYLGHTLGASGVMEIIACMASLKQNRLIATKGFATLGVPAPMNIITENTPGELHTFLKTASGFGGFNSAIVVSDKYTEPPPPKAAAGIRCSPPCRISGHKIWVGDTLVFEAPDADTPAAFLKAAFKNLHAPNMKFYKMDNLCKLGYVATAYLLQRHNIPPQYDGKNIALLFSNAAASLDTDIDHQLSICDGGNYFPSPAVFVYTLPNIVLGEICIREKIQGETAFFLSETGNMDFLRRYAAMLFRRTATQLAIAGRLECLGDTCEAETALISCNRLQVKACLRTALNPA